MTERADFFMAEDGSRNEKPFHYAACGLDYVYLLNGVTITRDPDYGDIVTIKAQSSLHRAIGLHIIQKRGMSGAEFKFLRKLMGYTQEALGWELELDAQTVALYEKKGRIPGPSQKLMRWQFLMFLVPPDTKAKVMSDLMKSNSERNVRRKTLGRERRKIVPYWHERGELAVACG
jgi:DNA-binding XRE family transcriptional regulator